MKAHRSRKRSFKKVLAKRIYWKRGKKQFINILFSSLIIFTRFMRLHYSLILVFNLLKSMNWKSEAEVADEYLIMKTSSPKIVNQNLLSQQSLLLFQQFLCFSMSSINIFSFSIFWVIFSLLYFSCVFFYLKLFDFVHLKKKETVKMILIKKQTRKFFWITLETRRTRFLWFLIMLLFWSILVPKMYANRQFLKKCKNENNF